MMSSSYKKIAAGFIAAAMAIAPIVPAEAHGWDHGRGGGGWGGGHGGYYHGGHGDGLLFGLIGGAVVAAATIATLPVRVLADAASPGPGYVERYDYPPPRYAYAYPPRGYYAPPPYIERTYVEQPYGYGY